MALQVKDFPATVPMDANGNSLHKKVEEQARDAKDPKAGVPAIPLLPAAARPLRRRCYPNASALSAASAISATFVLRQRDAYGARSAHETDGRDDAGTATTRGARR